MVFCTHSKYRFSLIKFLQNISESRAESAVPLLHRRFAAIQDDGSGRARLGLDRSPRRIHPPMSGLRRRTANQRVNRNAETADNLGPPNERN